MLLVSRFYLKVRILSNKKVTFATHILILVPKSNSEQIFVLI